MAKTGTTSKVTDGGSSRSTRTRRLLVDAAIETLKEEGFTRASARTIAERAGSNQGLIFYHFGSVANLLLAALDAVSAGPARASTTPPSSRSTLRSSSSTWPPASSARISMPATSPCWSR